MALLVKLSDYYKGSNILDLSSFSILSPQIYSVLNSLINIYIMFSILVLSLYLVVLVSFAARRVLAELVPFRAPKVKKSVKWMTFQHSFKRLFEFTLALIMVFALAPYFLIIALLILIVDGAPVIYKQLRIGKNGQTFDYYKFRTMRKVQKTSGKDIKWQNPQLSVVGKFLRKYSMDELPSFINVLNGNMNIVGPHPLQAHEFELIASKRRTFYEKEANFSSEAMLKIDSDIDDEIDFWLEMRNKVKPGLTGLLQVTYSTSDLESPLEWIQKENEYYRNWSLRLDVKILLRAVRLSITGHSA